MMDRIRSRITEIRRSKDDGLLSLVLVVIVIGVGLAALMTPLVLNQSRSTTHTDSSLQALDSAEAGVNAMLGRLRKTVKNASGTVTGLPCYPTTSPLPGTQAGSSPATYSVSVQYSLSDPLGSVPGVLSCTAISLGSIPGFARITSVGTAGTGANAVTRRLSATYSFDTQDIYNSTSSTAVLSGGQIRFNPRVATSQPRCLDAGTVPAPAVGTSLTVAACGVASTASQLFSYTADLSLRLYNSISAAAPNGLCLDSISPSTRVTLVNCPSQGQATYDLRWSLNDNTAFVQTRPDSTTWCLYIPLNSSTTVTAKACDGSYDTTASWQLTPGAGTGAAGAGLGQLVNLSQAARCAQVPNQTVPSTNPTAFLILYPCQQTSNPANVGWFQKFSFDTGTGHWVTTKTGDTSSYCLTSPGTNGGLVTVTLCSAAANQTWTDNGAALANQSNANQYAARNRYTVTDQSGRCLSLTATSGSAAQWYTPPGTTLQYSKLTTETCDAGSDGAGVARQKWNANPSTNSSVLRDTREN